MKIKCITLHILTIFKKKVDSNHSVVHTITQLKRVDPKLDSTLTYTVRIFKLSLTDNEKIGNNIHTEILTYIMSSNSSVVHTIRSSFHKLNTKGMPSTTTKFDKNRI